MHIASNILVGVLALMLGGTGMANGETPWEKSLAGEWRFMLVTPERPGPEKAFFNPDFDGGDWAAIRVPGNWEMQGFEKFIYETPSDSIGLYRTTFDLPETWQARHTFIRFDGVLFGFDCWVNGQHAGSSASAFTPSEFDISPYLAPSKQNVLAVRVSKRSHGYEFDCHDDWALSGIFRDVTLFSQPNIHIEDVSVVTTAGNPAMVNVRTRIGAFDGKAPASGLSIQGRLYDASGNVAGEFDAPAGAAGEVSKDIAVRSPKLWNAETPCLYRLDLSLLNRGRSADAYSCRVGIRTVSIEDGVLLLNGTPIKLHGVDRHTIHPAAGRAFTEEIQQQDIALMKAANINAIRASHNPPERRFMDLCDEQGLYVICEVPFGGGAIHLDDPSYQEDLLKRAEATVLRDRNRPSVIIWSVGNENPYTPLVGETVKRVKALDPTRPVCLPETNTYARENMAALPGFIDICAPHYPNEKQLEAWAQEMPRPILATEFCHALGNAFEGLNVLWNTMYRYDRLAGGCIWHWCDQGVYREAAPGEFEADAGKLIEGKVYLTPNRLMDSFGNKGSDGIVYADRQPQVDYWVTRNVFSPVQFSTRELTAQPGRQTLTLNVENRYAFTNLSSNRFHWELFQNREMIAEGGLEITLAPRQTCAVPLTLDVPADIDRSDCRIEIACTDASGIDICDHVIRLVPGDGTPDWRALLERETKDAPPLPSPGLRVDRPSGTITVFAGSSPIAEGFLARAGRRPTMAENHVKGRIYGKHDFYWDPYLLSAQAGGFRAKERKRGGDYTWKIEARYPRVDKAGQELDGAFVLRENKCGWVDATYDLTPKDATGFFLEAGTSMRLAANITEIRWLGDGPYYSYPGTEEAAQHGIHHVSRNGLSFEGNRARVELLAATDKAGNGIGILCAPSNMAWETTANGVILSHNALVSGRGNKGTRTRFSIPASTASPIQGDFRLIRLEAGHWPSVFLRVFGGETPSEEPPPSPYLRACE